MADKEYKVILSVHIPADKNAASIAYYKGRTIDIRQAKYMIENDQVELLYTSDGTNGIIYGYIGKGGQVIKENRRPLYDFISKFFRKQIK